MTMRPWKVLARRSLLKIPPWIEVASEQVELPSGQIIDDYYTIKLLDYAVIVALTPDGYVVAERHYKHALRTVTLCLPAGYLDDGEVPLDGAQRELREETGYASNNWTALGKFVIDGNRGCGTAHFFLAQDCRKVGQPDGSDLEEIQIAFLTIEAMLSELQDGLRSGHALEMPTLTALSLARNELSDPSSTPPKGT